MTGHLNFHREAETKAAELKLWLVTRWPSPVLAGGGGAEDVGWFLWFAQRP